MSWITLYVILLYGDQWLHTMFSGANLHTCVQICDLHNGLFEHVSVTKGTCPELANCCLVPWKILCIGWWIIARYFWLTHQKFKEILSFVPANYRSTCRKLSNFWANFWQNIVEQRTKFTHFFCTILQA